MIINDTDTTAVCKHNLKVQDTIQILTPTEAVSVS